MQEPWDFREFRLKPREPRTAGRTVHFAPVPSNNSPVPGLFDLDSADPKACQPSIEPLFVVVSVAGAATRHRHAPGHPRALLSCRRQRTRRSPARPNFVDRVRQNPEAVGFIADIDTERATLRSRLPSPTTRSRTNRFSSASPLSPVPAVTLLRRCLVRSEAWAAAWFGRTASAKRTSTKTGSYRKRWSRPCCRTERTCSPRT